jgi:uncharacterized protein YecT (DUF1311 family)
MRLLSILVTLLAVPPAYGQDGIDSVSNSVVSELSARSNISEPELRQLLSDCSRTQMSMNICMFYEFVKENLNRKTVARDRAAILGPSCAATFARRQATWELRRDRACNLNADREARGGSMRPMAFSSCRAVATEARTKRLERVTRCEDIPE